jgi:hypothetical protein
VLTSYVPDLEVALVEVDQADILSNSGDRVQSRIVFRVIQALDLLKQSSFAGVVQSEEEDGVFWEVYCQRFALKYM